MVKVEILSTVIYIYMYIYIYILLTKITAAQNEIALKSYHRVRWLYLLAIASAATIIYV